VRSIIIIKTRVIIIVAWVLLPSLATCALYVTLYLVYLWPVWLCRKGKVLKVMKTRKRMQVRRKPRQQQQPPQQDLAHQMKKRKKMRMKTR